MLQSTLSFDHSLIAPLSKSHRNSSCTYRLGQHSEPLLSSNASLGFILKPNVHSAIHTSGVLCLLIYDLAVHALLSSRSDTQREGY